MPAAKRKGRRRRRGGSRPRDPIRRAEYTSAVAATDAFQRGDHIGYHLNLTRASAAADDLKRRDNRQPLRHTWF